MANQLKRVFVDRYLRFTMVMQHDKGCNKGVDMNTIFKNGGYLLHFTERNFMKVFLKAY